MKMHNQPVVNLDERKHINRDERRLKMATTSKNQAVDQCIEECFQCVRACATCSDECLSYDPAKMVECIRLCEECIDVCNPCAILMSRNSRFAHQICGICADVCETCAAECDKYKDKETMRKCAEVCRACAKSCREVGKAGPVRRAA